MVTTKQNIMTPKEKAKELYSKYDFVYIQNYTSSHEVKQCALIAVDELISDWSCFNGMYEQEVFDSQLKYWQKVKEEIEKL